MNFPAPSRLQATSSACGFTLLEMVAVLFVVGIISSMVIPRLPIMQASLDFALKRESFEQSMNGLAYRALKDSQDFMLAGTYNHNGPVDQGASTTSYEDTLPGSNTILTGVETTRVMLQPVVMSTVVPPLPEGWRITFETPIQYRASGYCTGGTARVEVGKRRYSYNFKPPLCEIELER